MKILYTILILTLSSFLLSCGDGTDDIKKEAPPPEVDETETPHTSRATAGDVPGKFDMLDEGVVGITLIGREPRDGV